MNQIQFVAGYKLRPGTGLDRALLVKYMQRTYEELYPDGSFAHLVQTVEQYFSPETPLWWVEVEPLLSSPHELSSVEPAAIELPAIEPSAIEPSVRQSPAIEPSLNEIFRRRSTATAIGCLWLGTAIDQVNGCRYPHIFLLYVQPLHRRQGIGSALMRYAEAWAKARGDRQIGLQVFQQNQPALNLYEKLGYQPQSLWMMKSIE